MSRLKELRDERQLSREALGAAAGGVSSATIFRLERGMISRPHQATLNALAAALDVEVEEIWSMPVERAA